MWRMIWILLAALVTIGCGLNDERPRTVESLNEIGNQKIHLNDERPRTVESLNEIGNQEIHSKGNRFDFRDMNPVDIPHRKRLSTFDEYIQTVNPRR